MHGGDADIVHDADAEAHRQRAEADAQPRPATRRARRRRRSRPRARRSGTTAASAGRDSRRRSGSSPPTCRRNAWPRCPSPGSAPSPPTPACAARRRRCQDGRRATGRRNCPEWRSRPKARPATAREEPSLISEAFPPIEKRIPCRQACCVMTKQTQRGAICRPSASACGHGSLSRLRQRDPKRASDGHGAT